MAKFVLVNFFDKKLLKFLLVGIANTVFGAGVMFMLYNALGCSYWLSTGASYVLCGVLSFFLNKFFTFQNKRKSLAQIFFFAMNLAVCYFLAYFFAKQAVLLILGSQSEKLRTNIAMGVGLVLYTALNYLGQKFFVFREEANDH